MEKLDKLAVKSGLAILQMMELAGWHMAALFKILGVKKSADIVIACGKGNNGGDGLAAARHLANQGWSRLRLLLASADLNESAGRQLRLLKRMKLPVLLFTDNERKSQKLIKEAGVIIDALLGYHLRGNPKKPYNQIIAQLNQARAKVMAYDLPSGMDAAGRCLEPCVKADYTLTLALPKQAFKTKKGRRQSGQIYVADIGIPAFLYNRIRQASRPNFRQGLIKL